MNNSCVVYTADPDLVRRVRAFLASLADVRSVSRANDLQRELDRAAFPLVVFDIRGRESQALLQEIVQARPEAVVIVLGTPRSEPMLMAESLGVYALEDIEAEGRRIQALVRQALRQLDLSEELRLLQERIRRLALPPQAVPQAAPETGAGLPLRATFPPLRHFQNVGSLVQGIIDGIAGAGVVLRAGIFVFSSERQAYRLAAALACREETGALEFAGDDPLVRWLEINARLVFHGTLDHISDGGDRRMLQRALDAMGAELLVPLHGHKRLIGWLFLGARSAGVSFDATDIRDVVVYAEHVAMAIENAILYEEVALQKTFAEALLQSLPTGIAAADEAGRIRWVSDSVDRILGARRAPLVNRPVEELGSRIAGRIRAALRGDPEADQTQEWTDPLSKRSLRLQTRPLTNRGACLGAVAFIHDVTDERMLAQKQRDLDRSAFWSELAANMSHEVRNPLVTIKTFAQLLPERFADAEFREEFSALMCQEVDRLNSIIEQINTFANLPPPEIKSVEIREALNDAIELAKIRASPNGVVFKSAIRDRIPRVRGDRQALAECFAHILANSIEALHGAKNPNIDVSVRNVPAAPYAAGGVEVSIHDNGRGIPLEIRSNVFSPFCTTKGNGMGLGLPIAQRTVLDHDGQIHIDSGENGTTVTVLLPAEPLETEEKP